jgi:hypothetical protein
VQGRKSDLISWLRRFLAGAHGANQVSYTLVSMEINRPFIPPVRWDAASR